MAYLRKVSLELHFVVEPFSYGTFFTQSEIRGENGTHATTHHVSTRGGERYVTPHAHMRVHEQAYDHAHLQNAVRNLAHTNGKVPTTPHAHTHRLCGPAPRTNMRYEKVPGIRVCNEQIDSKYHSSDFKNPHKIRSAVRRTRHKPELEATSPH